MKYRILVLLSVILVSLAGIAQDNVTGVVLNEKGKPVKKVKMRVKGRMKMLSTSSKGTFELAIHCWSILTESWWLMCLCQEFQLIPYIWGRIHCAMPRVKKQ